MTGHLSKDSPDLVFPISYHFCLGPASHLKSTYEWYYCFFCLSISDSFDAFRFNRLNLESDIVWDWTFLISLCILISTKKYHVAEYYSLIPRPPYKTCTWYREMCTVIAISIGGGVVFFNHPKSLICILMSFMLLALFCHQKLVREYNNTFKI